MLREIITPTVPIVTMRLPGEMVGLSKEQRLQLIDDLTANTMVDLTNFAFNRDEANNYNEKPNG